jgi:acid stress-induced BolA-like protein IbaG/YrbA
MQIVKEIINILIEEFPNEEDIVKFIDERGDSKHFSLSIVSDRFKDLSRVKRSQLVYSLLNDYIKTGKIHALKLKLKTHSE